MSLSHPDQISGLRVSVTDTPSDVERLTVDAGLEAFNQAAAPLSDVQPLAALVRDVAGKVVGGAVGRTWGACCELEQLWVDEVARHQGWGSQLLRAFEDRARERGCRIFYLTTLSFQAPEFYRRHGYTAISQIGGHPQSISKIVMHKVDVPGQAGGSTAISSLHLRLSDVAEESVRQRIVAPLAEYNLQAAGPGHGRPVVITLEDEAGEIVGGLWGYTGYEWLFTQLLAVPASHRRQGLGQRLLAMAEAEALARGCTGAWLDTFEFQARGFYERLGYTCFAELPDYPRGFKRFFLRKALKP
jgi:GNAT superfamily N-acetyltransferase